MKIEAFNSETHATENIPAQALANIVEHIRSICSRPTGAIEVEEMLVCAVRLDGGEGKYMIDWDWSYLDFNVDGTFMGRRDYPQFPNAFKAW